MHGCPLHAANVAGARSAQGVVTVHRVVSFASAKVASVSEIVDQVYVMTWLNSHKPCLSMGLTGATWHMKPYTCVFGLPHACATTVELAVFDSQEKFCRSDNDDDRDSRRASGAGTA